MHIGSTISHYRIVEKLGEGGMGVVYKAEDTTLERAVALKFLADHLLNDAEAKERFLREAKAAAALHHPNVCPVHEIGEADGKTFLAMAFLKGETLEERIAKGPLAIKDALDIARQVADGLQAAHAEGIVHRDIKPANILVSPEGRPTIMDFGLARLTEASRLTKVDTAMGTVAYMSPEQAQGMEVDARSDVWSLGCVLYEMVSGQRPFLGQYDQALLYEIVHEEVAPLTSIRAGVPMELEFIVGKCLAKDREDRYGYAQEVAKDLRTLGEKLKSGRSTILRTTNVPAGVSTTTMVGPTVNPAQALPPGVVLVQRTSQRMLQALAVVATLALLALAFLHFNQPSPERSVARFSFTPEGLTRARISPDGKYILFISQVEDRSSLWLRSLSDESSREVAGTEGAVDGFWSPDSDLIGFATSPPGQLKRVPIAGGSPMTLTELPSANNAWYGGTWSPDGERIVFCSGLRLYEIPARGGQPRLLFEPGDGPRPFFAYPHFLPTGDGPPALVYDAAAVASDQALELMNLQTGERRELGPGSEPVYSENGYLIFGPGEPSDGGLWAWPFSLASLQTSGDPFPIATAGQGATVSNDGTLVYRDQRGAAFVRTLVWRDRKGAELEKIGQPQLQMSQPALSPEGQRVAVQSTESGTSDIWIQDLVRSTKTRLTFDAARDLQPTWSPSGDEILYESRAAGSAVISTKRADGTGEAVKLVSDENNFLPNPEWSADGKYLVYQVNNAETGSDIVYRKIQTDGSVSEPVTFLDSPARERVPKLSPAGRFLAYVSDESGRNEIYIRPFPDGAGRWQASVNGGMQPLWGRTGSELFYVKDDALMAVDVTVAPTLALGQPQQLFQSEDLRAPSVALRYDVSADGQKFLTVTPVEGVSAAPPSVRVVMNWYEEFRDRER